MYQIGVLNPDPESHNRMAAFIPAMDAILLDFSERYNSHFIHLGRLSSLISTIVHNKNWDDLKEGYEKYKDLPKVTCTDLPLVERRNGEAEDSYFGLNSCQEQISPKIFALLTITTLHCLCKYIGTNCRKEKM